MLGLIRREPPAERVGVGLEIREKSGEFVDAVAYRKIHANSGVFG